MKNEIKFTAASALHILLKRTVNEREDLAERLIADNTLVNREDLRSLILEKLESEYKPKPYVVSQKETPELASRFWLLSTLGIVGGDDAAKYLREQLSLKPQEDHPKARFWALEALVRMHAPDVDKVAQELLRHQDDRKATQSPEGKALEAANKIDPSMEQPLVIWLAKAILASPNGHQIEACQAFLDQVAPQGDYQARRAMRYVPLEVVIKKMCDWVLDDKLDELVGDAVPVLMRLPQDHRYAGLACDALIAFLRRARDHAFFNDLRCIALHGLRRLRALEAEPVLIEELKSPNLAILHEAARALEAIKGVPGATEQIVRVAAESPQFALPQYGNALRCMDREQVAKELERIMTNGESDMQDAARDLLAEIGGRSAFDKLRSREETMRQYLERLRATDENMRKQFERTMDEARSGYMFANMMNLAVFLIGMAFLGVFLVLIMQDSSMVNGAISKIVTGAGGALAVVYNLFVSKPMDRVSRSVRQIMSLKVTFLGYLRQLDQADLAYNRRFLEAQSLTTSEIREFEDILDKVMQAALIQVNANVYNKATADTPSVVA